MPAQETPVKSRAQMAMHRHVEKRTHPNLKLAECVYIKIKKHMYTDNVSVFKSDVHQAEVWCLPTSRPTALAQGWTGHRCERCLFPRSWGHTVDGRNPAPVGMVDTPLFTGFYTSEVVVWDFFNQQHCWYRKHRKSLTSGNFVMNRFDIYIYIHKP